MTAQPRKRATKKTTPRARAKETVAEGAPDEQTDQTVVAPPPAVDDAAALVPPPVAPTAQLPDNLAGLGPCVTCGNPGVVKVELPYTADKPVFCRKDTPAQYRRFL